MPAGISRLLELTKTEKQTMAEKNLVPRWVNVSTGKNQAEVDTHVALMKDLGWDSSASARKIGDLQLFTTSKENWERRKLEKSELNRSIMQGMRERATMELDREASQLRGVRPIGNDGAGIDFDKKFRARGEKVAISHPTEED